jgi:branched-chain amino acid aminotransferase
MEYIHQYIIKDGVPVKTYEYEKKGAILIYEVLRIIEGVPMFLEKHAQRLRNSSELLKKDLPFSSDEFKNLIENTIKINGISEGNIKVFLEYDDNQNVLQYHIGFIPHSYPLPETYRNGVKAITVQTQRLNPKAKVQNDLLRNEINSQIKEQDAFEAILVNPEGNITEGSRSNVFFIKENEIFTAPDDLVLSGITRENILKICLENNFRINLRPVRFDDLNNFDSAFLTGTSPKVLAIRCIDSVNFELPHTMIETITKKYNQLITDYISGNKK